MSKEGDLERFALEYSLFEVDEVSSLEDVNGYLEVFLDDLDEYSDTFKKEVKLNKLEKIVKKTINMGFLCYNLGVLKGRYYE